MTLLGSCQLCLAIILPVVTLGVILFDKSILHDPPLFVVDSASRWLEVVRVVKKGGDNKILAEFRGMLWKFGKYLVMCSQLLRSAGFTNKYLLILLLKYYFIYRSPL